MNCIWPCSCATFVPWSSIIVTMQTRNLCPSSWGNRINVQPIIYLGHLLGLVEECFEQKIMFNKDFHLGWLGYPCFLGSLFSPVLPGILSWGRFILSSWGGRRNAQPIILYSLRNGTLGHFFSPCLLRSFLYPFLPGVLSKGIFTTYLSYLETRGGLWSILRKDSLFYTWLVDFWWRGTDPHKYIQGEGWM